MEFISRDNGEFKTQIELNSIASLHYGNIPLFEIWFVIELNCRNEIGNEIVKQHGGVHFEPGFVLFQVSSVFSSFNCSAFEKWPKGAKPFMCFNKLSAINGFIPILIGY